ncbi:glycosyltransferase family 2 protein [Cohnella yongneupensis]|uniref:Glycosyltransferase family 2 protein n=1 Tax=Cohnella yongneupensis TaxID=425006 RepID=A0ABW0QW08_9BACL
MSAKVSIVIACYNKAEYIGDTLRSIINQAWNQIEVVLVNDGSTDETGSVIKEWEPRLSARGFDVIVINQANAGVAAAVKTGLLRSTGKYVCFPDADDELDPEYVSEPVRLLEADPSVDFAVCGLAARSIPNGTPVSVTFTDEISPNTAIEQVLLQRVHSSACVYLITREYAERCGLMRMVTDGAASQEPQITTLLFAHEHKLEKIDRPFYIYNTFSSALAAGRGEQQVSEHYRNRLRLYEQTIEQLSISPEDKARLKGMAAIGCRYMVTSIMMDGDADNEVFFRSLTNAILGVKPICQRVTGRIIAFGSLGKVARGLLPLLKGTPWEPHLFWDQAAFPGAALHDGSVVTKPDENHLERGDVLFCFPKSPAVFAEVHKIASSKGVTVLTWSDVIDYLAEQYNPLLHC